MAARSRTREADRSISRLAARQHGVVGARQLLAAGVTRHQIALRLASGRLHEIHRGVYLVGHSVEPPLAREQAALLAGGPSAVLSYRTATSLWKLLPYPSTAPVCITVPPARGAARPGTKTYRGVIEARDIRAHRGLRLTSPPRTIIDLAHELDLERLEQLVAEASYRRLASDAELKAQLARNPGKRGNATLRCVLDLPGGPQRTRSPGEVRMKNLLRRSGLTDWELNARIHGFEVDVLWRELNFGIELDGWDGHRGYVAFERDRLKIAKLQARGVVIMPVTGRLLRDDPVGVRTRLLEALTLRGYREAD
jgi:hypothetical protein